MELIVKLTRKINPTIYQNSHRQTKKIMIQIKFHKMLIKINRKQIKINPMNWKLYMLTKMEILRVRSLKKLKKVQLQIIIQREPTLLDLLTNTTDILNWLILYHKLKKIIKQKFKKIKMIELKRLKRMKLQKKRLLKRKPS